MIEKFFSKGKTFTGLEFFNEETTNGAGNEVSNDILDLTYSYSESRFLRSSVTRTGNGYFIPWSPNGINYTPQNGRDVISGPFTGCVMALYTSGGANRVCHVATPDCNTGWANLKGQPGVNLIKEFKPADSAAANFKMLKKKLAGGMYVLGVITAEPRYYSIVLSKLHNAGEFTVTAKYDVT